jgi:hypothetical protein
MSAILIDDLLDDAPLRYTGESDVMSVLRRMAPAQAAIVARGWLTLFEARPDMRRQFSLADLAFLQAAAGWASMYAKPDDLLAQIDAAAARTDPEPTEGQRTSGNYRKGKVTVQGLPITIENAAGSERSGTDGNGQPWSVTMQHHYGYIRKTESDADGDHVDVFLGPHPASDVVFIVDQTDGDGGFDEHKVLLGFTNEAEARAAYLANYSPGWDRLGAITAMPVEDFKDWLDGDTSEPVGDLPSPPDYHALATWYADLLNSYLASGQGISIEEMDRIADELEQGEWSLDYSSARARSGG